MNNISNIAASYCRDYGFHLLQIKPKSKLPMVKDWGNNCISDEKQAAKIWSNESLNIGLELGHSKMCSLDIDCAESFQIILEKYGIDPSELKKYPTIKGRGERILFKMPKGVKLPYVNILWEPKDNSERKNYTVVEFRANCENKARFDVLPPSIHPNTGKPYEWATDIPRSINEWPEPPAWLLAMWVNPNIKEELQSVCPWKKPEPQKEQPKAEPLRAMEATTDDVQDAFNSAHDIQVMLERYGYKNQGNDRYMSPHASGKGDPGVQVFKDKSKCYIYSASDPLCGESTGQPVSPYDLYCYYEHGNNRSEAYKAAAKLMGISLKSQIQEKVKEKTDARREVAKSDESEFRCLGYNNNKLFILPKSTGQIKKIPSESASNKGQLTSIAPLSHWECLYGVDGGKNITIAWDAAGSDLIQNCYKAGIFNPEKIRGRGAWFDGGKSVLHLGDKLIIDGEESSLCDFNSKFAYTKQLAFETKVWSKRPAEASESKVLIDIFSKLRWEKPEHAYLALGWTMLAPICGALSWRPHIWLTARRASGKTWFLSNIIDNLVGGILLNCQGSTTEAGIRQSIQNDARPVLFDEAEAESQKDAGRIQGVIQLARQSSSDSKSETRKGTATGESMSFKMRAMFFMASINVSLEQASDMSRFSILKLQKGMSTDEFNQFDNYIRGLLTDEYCSSIRARIYRMIPVIRKNAKTFETVVARQMDNQRSGEQIGTLLAGAMATMMDGEITEQQAEIFISEFDMSETVENMDISDEDSCLTAILQHKLIVELGDGRVTRSIGELIDAAAGNTSRLNMAAEAADSLPRCGIKVDGKSVLIANKHPEIKRALEKTAWCSNWHNVLERLPGATKGAAATRFAGAQSRYVKIPLNVFTD